MVLILAFMTYTALVFSLGAIGGWLQRDQDKARDAVKLAEAILRRCEQDEKPKLRRAK